MIDWMLAHEPVVRMLAFAAVFGAMAIWETASSRRELNLGRGGRWVANLGLLVVNSVALRLVSPLAAVGIAWVAVDRGWGLFQAVAAPPFLEVLLCVILLDLVIYLQHVLFHAVPALWRLHKVHHADLDFDVTTGVRFHTLEILISLVIKAAAVVALGATPLAVLLFEILLNATSVFNHANVRIPAPLDAVLRWLVVTPDMHRIHHSVVVRETNSNYGFNLPWWDRLLGTYRREPAAGYDGMEVGVREHLEPRRQTLPWLLALPFRRTAGRADTAGRPPTQES